MADDPSDFLSSATPAMTAFSKRTGVPLRALIATKRRDVADTRTERSASIAAAIADGMRRHGGIYVVIGAPGTGKTCIAAMVCRVLDSRAVDMNRAVYLRASELSAKIRASFADGSRESESSVMAALKRSSLLMIDEVQDAAGTEFEKRVLNELVDWRYAACKPTLLLGNINPDGLSPVLGDRILDRVRETGKTYFLSWRSIRSKQEVSQ